MNADELFEKCWNEDKFGHTNDRKTLAYYAFIEGMQQVKNLNIPAVIKSVCQHEPIDKDVPFPICKHCGDMML